MLLSVGLTLNSVPARAFLIQVSDCEDHEDIAQAFRVQPCSWVWVSWDELSLLRACIALNIFPFYLIFVCHRNEKGNLEILTARSWFPSALTLSHDLQAWFLGLRASSCCSIKALHSVIPQTLPYRQGPACTGPDRHYLLSPPAGGHVSHPSQTSRTCFAQHSSEILGQIHTGR